MAFAQFVKAQDTASEWTVTLMQMESIALFASEYVEAARDEDLDKILRLGCLQLEQSTEYLRPNAYGNEERRQEILSLQKRAVSLFNELNAQGYCE
jgi:hypothetical protein